MRYKHPIKQILIAARSVWDSPESRTAVRHNFDKMGQMRNARVRRRNLLLWH
jgi:hypothetical protein